MESYWASAKVDQQIVFLGLWGRLSSRDKCRGSAPCHWGRNLCVCRSPVSVDVSTESRIQKHVRNESRNENHRRSSGAHNCTGELRWPTLNEVVHAADAPLMNTVPGPALKFVSSKVSVCALGAAHTPYLRARRCRHRPWECRAGVVGRGCSSCRT